MKSNTQHVLLVEDNAGDARLIREFLRFSGRGRFTLTHVERLATGLQRLDEEDVAVVLLDLSLPDSQGWDTFERVHTHAPSVPVVILTGLRDEDLALRAASSGAQDYLIKDEIGGALLVRTLSYAVERAQLLRQQHKLNRALNVLSDVNQTVVRATDEQQLLNDVCHILIDRGGYPLAWVGFAGTGAEEKRVRPVAQAGVAQAFLDTAPIPWAEGEHDRGPAGIAIRTGRVCVVQDVQSDPRFEPWRGAALAHGLLASVALPLSDNEHTLGALNLYATAPDAFDEEEIRLLAELADDLAYGIENFRTDVALHQSEEQFSKAFRASPIGIALTSLEDERIIDVNDSALSLFGYSREEVLGRKTGELGIWRRTDWRRRILKTLRQGSKVRDLELEAQTRSGERRHVLASFERMKLGDTPCILALLHDITERKETEEQVHQYNERLTVLREIEQAILAARSPASIAQATLSRLQRLIPHQRASVVLFDPAGDEVTMLAVAGTVETEIKAGDRLPRQMYGDVAQLRQGDYHLVEDIRASAQYSPTGRQLLAAGLRAILSVPLLAQDSLIGALNLSATIPDAFTPEHAQIAQEVAGSLAVALQNAQLFQETQHQTRRLSDLYETALTINSTLERDALLTRLARQVEQLLAPDSLAVVLYDEKTTTIEVALAWEKGKALPKLEGTERPLADAGLSGWVVRERQPLLIRDMEREDLPVAPYHGTRPAVSWLGVPLRVRDRVTGVLSAQSFRAHAFDETHRRLLEMVAAQVAIAIHNADLFAETERLLRQTREQARQVQQIVETVPEGMVLLDTRRRILLLNPTAADYLSDLTPAQTGDVLSSLGGEPLDRFLEPVANGSPWHELAVGEEKQIFELAARPIEATGPNGTDAQRGGWVLVLRNVTEERERQEYFQAQERLATVGQLAAGIAHDFNNIMAVIALYSGTLERNPDYERRLHYLRTINEQAQHAANLIGQILDFSRRSIVERSKLDLLPFIKEVTKLLKRTLPETITVRLTAKSDQYWVNVDPTRLQQVVMNLAVNARDAMPEGGTLQIALASLHVSSQEHSPLPDMRQGEWVCLTVTDTGCGIPAEELGHVFEPFFTTKEPGRGVGLGLAQVYGIVKQHGGEIDVTSTVGKGTTFTIYLPLVSLTPSLSPTQGKVATPAGGDDQLILLVEDNTVAREAMADVLKALDYRVLEAGNGQEALRLFTEHSDEIALVISDMVMPEMGGSQLHAQLTEMQPDVKVIVMTGYPLEEEGKELLSQGIVAWMQKPFNVEKLTAVIQDALN